MRRQQRHAYDPAEIESLKGVPIPDKIKCGRCAKNLPHIKYSTKQLTDFRYQVKHQGRVTKPILCHGCTGGSQIVELECVMCHKTKGIEDFAKSQKAKPDTAKCFKCIEDQLRQRPINHDRYAAGNRPFVTPDHVNGHTVDYWSSADSNVDSEAINEEWAEWARSTGPTARTEDDTRSTSASSRRATSVNGSNNGVLIGSEFSASDRPRDNGEGEWTRVGEQSWRTRSTGPTATSNDGSQRTYASSVAERSTGTDRTGGWARIPAYTGPPMMPYGDAQREMDAAWGSDDDSSEGETNDDEDEDSDGENTVI